MSSEESSPSMSMSLPTKSSREIIPLSKEDPMTKLVYHPPKKFKREKSAIPFHVPHKKLLEKIEFKKELPEPLTGFKQRQNRLLKPLEPEITTKITIGASGLDSDSTASSSSGARKHSPHSPLNVARIFFRSSHDDKLEQRKRRPPEGLANQIELIRKVRENPEFNFYYMSYAIDRSSEFFTPYCLRVVPYEEIDKRNYLTISSHGVTQYYDDVMDFTPLKLWEHEYKMYCQVKEIKMFKMFRVWKAFFVWHESIRYHKFQAASKFLNKNLFLLNPTLRNTILAINAMCVKLESANFTETNAKENFLLFYFMEAQLGQIELIKSKLVEYRSVAKQLLLTSAYEALNLSGFSVEEKQTTVQIAGVKSSKSAPVKLSYIDQAKKRRQCENICNFLMLADFITVHMLHLLMVNSFRDFELLLRKQIEFLPSEADLNGMDVTAELEPPRPKNAPKHPLINFELLLSPQALTIDPSREIFMQAFNNLIDFWDEIIYDGMEPFINDPVFISFTTPTINGKTEDRLCGFGPSLKAVLDLDAEIVEQRIQIFSYLNRNWDAMMAYIKRFEPIRIFFAEDCAMDREAIVNERNLEYFRLWCKRYTNELDMIEAVVEEQALGLFHLKIGGIKVTAQPQPESLLSVIDQTAPIIGKEKVDSLLQQVDDATEYLGKEPTNTQEFVEYLDYLDKITMTVDIIESELDYAKELYDIMDEYGIPIPPEDMETYLNASSYITNLRNYSDQCISEKDKVINNLSKCIMKDIVILFEQVTVLRQDILQPWLLNIKSDPDEVMKTLTRIDTELKEFQAKANSYRAYQKTYRLEVTRYEILDQTLNDVKLRLLLWETLTSWKQTIDEWYTNPFNQLDPEEMQNFTARNMKNIAMLEKGLPENAIVPMVKESVELMKDKLPVVTYLRNPALRPRHWAKIEEILKHKFRPDVPITLQLLEKLHVFSYPDELLEVAGQASSEASLEGMLKKVEDNWKGLEFSVMNHKDSKDIFILGSTEEVQAVLDESFITMNTINSSRNVGPIKPRVDEWLRQLDLFSKTLDEWTSVQQQWMYLEVIFSAPDIQRQLPTEAKMFIMIDKQWKEIMRRTAKVPLAMQAALHPGTLEIFQRANQILDQIMKCLEAYLEVKRTAFPRFYFLSNDELLEILAQTRNPHAVQPHLRKCFDAIAKLEFGKRVLNEEEDEEGSQIDKPINPDAVVVETTDIVAMISPEGERVDLGKGLKARGNVEDWLCKVEEAMFLTLRRKMKGSIQDNAETDRETWLQRHPNQIILTVSQIMWAKEVHLILDHSETKVADMAEFEITNIKNLNQLASMVRRDLDKVVRKILIALITIDVHARDTITLLVTNKVQSSNDFEWLKMIRYYWDKEIDNCLARMSNSLYVYGYEYLGAGGCLVITPLTDRCYLCLMGALQLDLGGAPAGPAGTGKTETTKDLSKSLAIQCVVFNCSEGLDYKMMGKFFSGLATSGAWCCFDEFNRIDIEVLSVIAQQLITIRNAKVAGLKRFMFEGREIKLVRSCAAFITMNPGYAGRTELPDNLKALFRPISMMVPDYGLIAEVTLYSEGFESSKVLAQKMVNMYKLCSEQLSQQDHYDFGMRAVKSVLVMAGALKRSNPDKNEDVVLIRALKDSNLPKFLADDAVLFQGILSDLFPGVVLPEPDYGIFLTAIEDVMISLGLQMESTQIRKVIQLHETMIVRWGVMLVGPTGGGKTTVLKILNLALTKMYNDGVVGPFYQPVFTYVLNPKSVTMGELYGEVNPFTMEWRDGLLGIYVRVAVTSGNESHQWVVCDGPVDAVWIENMNTVLDDNKMLCLANSERIKLTPYVHMVFEVQDLAQASPATVSRCGMVYIDAEELKWMPYVKTWISKFDETMLNEDIKEFILNELFDKYVEEGFIFIKKYCEHAINQVDISKVTMVCSLMESIFTQPGSIEKSMDKTRLKTYAAQAFVFSYIWGVGGNLTDSTRNKFEAFVHEKQFGEDEIAQIPTSSDLWNLYLNTQTKKMDNWWRLMPEFIYDPELPFFEMLVPTTDTVRFGYIMEKMLFVNKPIMFTGDTGVGKSVIAKSVLNTLLATGIWVPVTLNFSAQTSSARTQEILELKLEKRRKTLLGAPYGKKIVVFVDDVNMPKLDTYGSQPPIELLRQFLDFGGLYDRDKLFWKNIVDVTLTCACAPPGGGRNPLTARFVRHFGMLSIPSPDAPAMKVIFKAIMRGFFDDFAKEIQEMAEPLVNAAVEVYERIAQDLLPTPAKSHYVFNLRDLSKCVQGVLQADSGTLREPTIMRRLFFHECLRVFHDRLISMEDKSYFYYLLRDICGRNLGAPVLILPELGPGQYLTSPPLLLFGDFINPSVPKEERLYEEITNLEKLKSVLKEYLDDYNLIATKGMELIFFQDAVEHCTRLARVIRSERGNALLVGVGGMGKQSLTKLASHLNGCKCVQIELTRSYDHSSFFEDLRKMFYNAGCLSQQTVFIFTDTQIVQEEFVEDINNILNSGDVPSLFEADEYEKVQVGIRDVAKQAGIVDATRDGMYDFFISKVRANLHLALCMSPVGDAFRRRCRMFPSLVNCCSIDWFTKWPSEALLSVAENALQKISPEDPDDTVLPKKLAEICETMHQSVENMTVRFYQEMRRYYYTTPSSYLELLKLYRDMLNKKYEKIIKMRERIANGLKKLYETNSVVDSMKAELVAMEPTLKKKSQAVADLVITLTKEQAEADKVKETVLADETEAKEKAAITQELADDAQRDLDKALPAMEAAAKALDSLNKADINELRVFQKPPAMVKWVMEPVCILLGVKTDWDAAKKVMGDNFLKRLQEYDKNHIKDATLKKLVPYLEHKDFVPDVVAVVSKVCRSMCMWVIAIDSYAKVYKVVGPKMQKQKEAETELNAVMAVLRAKQKMLADVEAQIEKLQANYQSTLDEMQALKDVMDVTAGRLVRAGKLTSALGDEQGRWEQMVVNFGKQLVNLIGDVLVAAGSVAYLGAFTLVYRVELIELWLQTLKDCDIPLSESFSLITVLADPYEIRMWNTCGLPKDAISTENAIFVTQAGRWPLMIDPQEQANRWIRTMEGPNGLKITKLTDANFMRILEAGIRIGMPILLEEVGEKLDPTLSPILMKQTTIQGGRVMIRLGDSDVEYDTNFRFYITTKLANPHYLPEVCIQVTIVNFTVTPSGLEDQLLADVVRLERPDLETLRTECIVRINNDKAQLLAIEDKILKLLFASEGNILDDEELIETLNESKETSAVIAARLIEGEATEEKISIAREKYRTVATRGSVLYFVVAQLAEIDPMYQYSLKYFNNVFNNVIEISEKSPDLNVRLGILYREITLAVYTNISRGLFERHKLVFSFLLCINIFKNSGEISEGQWNFLIRGPVGSKTNKPKPHVYELTESAWNAVQYLETSYPSFEGLSKDCTKLITIEIGDYIQKINIINGNEHKAHIDWNVALNDFEKLMMIKAMREEKLVFGITSFVKLKLGKPFVESPQVTIHLLYQDTNNVTPLIFILSAGSDPFQAFQKFAAEMGCTEKIHSISLGQGQGPVAEKLMERGKTQGDWVFLQNCHLATSWMLSMERSIQKLSERGSKVHPEFRLYLSSMPSKAFPVSILQNSVKVTNEAPKGLRANIKRAFQEMTEDFFEGHPLDLDWRKIIFGICMFHAIIQERKKFGPLGWNITYEFNDSDRECALLNFRMFCAEGYIPWDALEYITGQITYGGRVTDSWDLRCLQTILKGFFSKPTLAPGYKYSKSGTYHCPEFVKLDEFREFIENLPIIEDPEVFGMHENANIAFQTKETQAVIVTIMESQPRSGGSSEGKSTDEIVAELADVIKKAIMPRIYCEEPYPAIITRDDRGRLPSLSTVLLQEIDRFNKLLRLIHSSLDTLQKAIKGFVVMSEQLEEVYNAFLNNQIPKMWAAKAYPSLKSLGSWIHDLVLRLDFVFKWYRDGPPLSFWLPGFFFPQGFLTGCLQTHARKYDLPIDILKFDFEITSIVVDQEEIYKAHELAGVEDLSVYGNVPRPKDGVVIHGLFLDAARWDINLGHLVDPRPGEMNPFLPSMLLIPLTHPAIEGRRYTCPLYKTAIRAGVLSTTGHSTNFVVPVLLPSEEPPYYWILKGTALLTMITD